MKSLAIVGTIILLMVLAKVFVFDKPDSKDKMAMNGGQGKPKQGGGMAMPVDVFIAQKLNNKNEVFASGTMVANEEVELRSEGSGRLIALNISEGSLVKKGQLIAKLNDADILARLKKIKFEQELSKQIEARQKKLLDINAISREEYDIAVNKVNTLNADEEALEVALSQTRIIAPFNGHIGLKNISNGSYVTPSTVIATLVQTNPIKIDFTVPEKYSNKLSVGKKIKFSLDGSDEIAEAVIKAIDPKIDEALRTIKVRAATQNINGKYMPGKFVRVVASLGESQAIMVPSEIIIPALGGKKIFVLESGKAIEKVITTGLRTEKMVEVISGLQVGDTVIASGIMNIKNDQKVKPKKIINQ